MTPNYNATILIVDDDQVDVRLVQRSLKKAKLINPVAVARDGHEALAMLRGEEGYAPVPAPHLILLDLNMPRLNGFEFLEALRTDATLHASIVFVLTTSHDDRDRAAAYEQHIAGYLLKDQVGEDLLIVGRLLEQFFIAVQLPPPLNLADSHDASRSEVR